MQAAVAGVLVACMSIPASACVNEFETTRQGHSAHLLFESAEVLDRDLGRQFDPEDNIEWANSRTQRVREDPSPQNLNDLAVVLIRFGRIPEAVRLLETIERRSPGLDKVAANLGTAYELAGDDAKALRWIREGMKRDPEDHWGTEWLHARILEAKLDRARKVPRDGSSVLHLDFGTGAIPTRPTSMPKNNVGRPVTMFQLGSALRYQITERTDFLAPPDPIVAGLLLDWANLELLAGTLETSIVLFDYAEKYGNPQTALIARRRAEAKRLLAAAGKNPREGSCELCEPPGSGGSF